MTRRRLAARSVLAVSVSALAVGAAVSGALAEGETEAQSQWDPAIEIVPVKREIELSASLGILNGEAREYVYDSGNGRTVSRLDWDFENVPMLTAGAAWQASDWFRFQLRGSTNLATHSKMADYDWNIGVCPPDGMGGDFCESYHSGTRLVSAYMLDASVRFHELTLAGFAIAPVAGFKWDYYSWRAYNGVANYAPDFNNGLGISYEQWWSTPYLGLEVSRTFGKLDLKARGIFSDWGEGHDRDHHHNRSILFKETFDNVRVYGADVGARYALTERVGVTLDYSFTSWQLTKGPATINDLANNTIGLVPGDAAGASNATHLVSLGVSIDLSPRTLEPAEAEPAERPAPIWTGGYAGAAVAAFWHEAAWSTAPGEFTQAAEATLNNLSPGASVFAGWTWQNGAYVWGAEAEIGRSSGDEYVNGIPGTAPPIALAAAPDSITIEQGWNGSLRLRGGILLTPSTLAYATGGLAYEHVYAYVSCAVTGPWCLANGWDKEGAQRWGWTLGGGVEAIVAGNVFLRGEYRYTDLGSFTGTYLAGEDAVTGTVDAADHRLTLGAGLRF
jgi:plasminogen activator